MHSSLAQQPFVESAKPPVEVEIEKIRPSRLNPPSRLRLENLEGLEETVGRYGILQCPLLRPLGDYYEIVFGHRRVEAARRAGMRGIRARVIDLSDTDALTLSILEDECREDRTPFEKAKAYAKLRDLGWSLRRIASLIHKDVSLVSRYLDILDLADPLQEMLTRVKELTEGHLRWISKLPKHDQLRISRVALDRKLTTRETELLVRKTLASQQRVGLSKGNVLHKGCPINDLEPDRWKEYSDEYNLQCYSVWPVKRHDPYFNVSGNIYPGCFPLTVAVNCILRFSKMGERVLDPCVGSGTTLIACAMLNRSGIGVDVNPEAQSAKDKRFMLVMEREPRLEKALQAQHFVPGDSRDLSFLGDASIDLVVTHPPYLDMKDYGPKGTYHHPSEYREFLRATFNEVHRVLKPQRYFCIQIAPYAARHAALHYMTYQIADQVGFRFVDEVIILFEDYVGYSSSASGRVSTARRKVSFGKYRSIATNSFLHNHEYVVLFQKQK
jgi:ParB/RepB/Spo0J family partition protein